MSPQALQSDFIRVELTRSITGRLLKVESRLHGNPDNLGHPSLAPASTELKRCPCCSDGLACRGLEASGCACQTCRDSMSCSCIRETAEGTTKVGWCKGKLFRYVDLSLPYWADGSQKDGVLGEVQGLGIRVVGVEVTDGVDAQGKVWNTSQHGVDAESCQKKEKSPLAEKLRLAKEEWEKRQETRRQELMLAIDQLIAEESGKSTSMNDGRTAEAECTSKSSMAELSDEERWARADPELFIAFLDELHGSARRAGWSLEETIKEAKYLLVGKGR